MSLSVLLPGVASVVTPAVSTVGNIQSTASGLSGTISTTVSSIESTLAAVGLGGVVSNTIGQVLSNGFNLSCWGASLTPQDAQNKIQTYYAPYFDYLLKGVNNASNATAIQSALNSYLVFAYQTEAYYRIWKLQQADWSSCAKKAINEVYKPFFSKMKQTADQLAQLVKQKGAAESSTTVKARYTIPGSVTGKSNYTAGVNKDTNTVTVPQFTLQPNFTFAEAAAPVAAAQGVVKASSGVTIKDLPKYVRNTDNPKDGGGSAFPWWILVPFLI